MLKKDFNTFISNLVEDFNIDDLIDVDKVINVYSSWNPQLDKINEFILDYQNFYVNLEKLLEKNEDLKTIIPLLFATRQLPLENSKMSSDKNSVINVHTNSKEIIELIKKSNFDNLIKQGIIKDIRTYLLGVEIGLDSNARKNRTGTKNSQWLSRELEKKQIDFKKEYSIANLAKDGYISQAELDKLLEISSGESRLRKVVDFLFTFNNQTYLVETNFYNAGGSKLNEVCKSYTYLQEEINKIAGLNFIWITDGKGWQSAHNQLENAYEKIPLLFNRQDFETHTLKELLL